MFNSTSTNTYNNGWLYYRYIEQFPSDIKEEIQFDLFNLKKSESCKPKSELLNRVWQKGHSRTPSDVHYVLFIVFAKISRRSITTNSRIQSDAE